MIYQIYIYNVPSCTEDNLSRNCSENHLVQCNGKLHKSSFPNTTPCRLCVHIYSFISLLHTHPRAHIPLCVYPQIYTEILLRKCRKIAYKNISYYIKVLSLINTACMWPHVVWEKQNRLNVSDSHLTHRLFHW